MVTENREIENRKVFKMTLKKVLLKAWSQDGSGPWLDRKDEEKDVISLNLKSSHQACGVSFREAVEEMRKHASVIWNESLRGGQT